MLGDFRVLPSLLWFLCLLPLCLRYLPPPRTRRWPPCFPQPRHFQPHCPSPFLLLGRQCYNRAKQSANSAINSCAVPRCSSVMSDPSLISLIIHATCSGFHSWVSLVRIEFASASDSSVVR